MAATEVTVREAVRLTGYSRQQIYNLLVEAKVPSRRQGHVHLIDRAALQEYVKRARRNGDGPKVEE